MIGGIPTLFNLCSWPDRPVGKAIVTIEHGGVIMYASG